MSLAGSAAEWAAFVSRIGSERDAPDQAAARIAELPSYRTVPPREIEPEVRRVFAMALAGLRARRPPGPGEDLSGYVRVGERRARQGVTLADMIAAWTIGVEVARGGAYRHAPAGEHREAFLLEAVELMAAWNTLGMNASAAAHRRVELELARQELHDAGNLVRGVLLGSAGRGIGHLERFGVDPAREHYAVRVRPGEGFGLGEIEAWLGTRPRPARRAGLLALIDGDVAGFVTELPGPQPVPACAGVAGPVPLAVIADTFRVASRALDAGVAMGRTGLTELRSLGLMPAVLSDADVGISLLDRYVRPLSADGRAGATILNTVRVYLDSDCQVPGTAAALGVHPNTIRYRISRFEQLTGCSLRDTEALVQTWWAVHRQAVAGQPGIG